MNSMKRQKQRTLKDELPKSVDAKYATVDSGEITSKRMRRQNQSKKKNKKKQKTIQLGMWLVMQVKSDAVKNSIA